ncbi:MAG: preprotein translocase subunit SecG [Hyphomonadaceae bacterium]
MELIVLSIHLLVCMCLIGLVLLQRSEGGALGMGGGGGGALMSGRGAADALAKMTSVAGGFFIVTSLALTLISGAASNTSGRSVMDLLPTTSAPATTDPAPATSEEPATPPATTPDPTEGRAPATNQFSLGPSNAAASTPTTQRAGPIENRPTQTAAATPQRQPASTTTTPQRTPAQSTTQRTVPATTQPAATQPAAPQRTTPPPAANVTGGAVTGIDLTTDNQLATESSDSGNAVTTVRRERAGPDQ